MTAAGQGSRTVWRLAFVVLMLALTAAFALLGFWQLQRLAEKEALIAKVAERMDDAPVAYPPAADWPALDPAGYDYRTVSVIGRFLAGRTVLAFTSLANARGEQGGPGYWVMTPLTLEKGGAVFVNRGFIPQAEAGGRVLFEPVEVAGPALTLTGIARRAESVSPFTPEPDVANRIDWVRDPARLAVLAGIDGSVAPIYLDLPAGAPGELPQGGETVFEFPNNHLGYALTWFGLALLTPILLVFWWRRSARGS